MAKRNFFPGNNFLSFRKLDNCSGSDHRPRRGNVIPEMGQNEGLLFHDANITQEEEKFNTGFSETSKPGPTFLSTQGRGLGFGYDRNPGFMV